jgi:hypothetical protein
MAGSNPMRWDCKSRGCFNQKKRPKIEQFAECFPGKIAMSDVDGITEINGHFLLLEWKVSKDCITTGQRILYERLTRLGSHLFTVYVVAGDAETMEVEALKVFSNGKGLEWQDRSKETLLASIRKWVAFVQKRPFPSPLALLEVAKS